MSAKPLRRAILHSRCRTIAVVLVLIGVSGMAQAQSKAEPTKKVAFLVGVNTYLKPGFDNLKYAEADVDAVAVQLRRLGFQAVVLKGSATGPLKATRANMLAQLAKLVAPLGKDDLMLVMLSGHGSQMPVKQADGKTKDDAFFCPYDAVANQPETLFSISYLIDDVLAKGVGRKFVMIDACRNEPKDPSRGSKGIQGRTVSLPENTAVLFSCRAGQLSFEKDEVKHGLFTHCLLDAFATRDNAGQTVTWTGLEFLVLEKMASRDVKALVPTGKEQSPIRSGNVGRTVLGRFPMTGFAGSKAGQEWGGNGLKTKFCWCPAGSFTMGSPANEKGRKDDDEDQVRVTLTKGFWLGKHEVTQGEWRLIMGTQPWSGEEYVKEGSEYAATYVSWDDAMEFCRKLTEQERRAGRSPSGWEFTLPTEAQWEYACRASSTTRFAFGDDESRLKDYAWFDVNAYDVDEKYAHEVGRKLGNAWGLRDMHGNVWELCRGWYGEKLPGGRDPEVIARASNRVCRGGCWAYSSSNCRSANRLRRSPGGRSSDVGFRLAILPSR